METIYIIDDETYVRKTLEEIFQAYGFSTVSFSDPHDALSQDLTEDNSCILLDLQMPQLDGLEVQRLLKQKGIRIPIVVYSGSADVKAAVNSMAEGAYTLIEKPAPNQLLVKKVRDAITSAHLNRTKSGDREKAEQKLSLLTEREREIANLVADGKTAPEIAERLFISKRTVEVHRAKIFEKLDVKNIAQLVQLVLLSQAEH